MVILRGAQTIPDSSNTRVPTSCTYTSNRGIDHVKILGEKSLKFNIRKIVKMLFVNQSRRLGTQSSIELPFRENKILQRAASAQTTEKPERGTIVVPGRTGRGPRECGRIHRCLRLGKPCSVFLLTIFHIFRRDTERPELSRILYISRFYRAFRNFSPRLSFVHTRCVPLRGN